MRKEILLKSIISSAFFLTCAFSVIDTQQFVYPSLSRYLILESGLVIIAAIWLCISFTGEAVVLKSELRLFLTVWVAYIVLYGLMLQPYELYRSVYLCVTLMSVIVLADMQKMEWLSRHNICTVLIVVAGIEIIYI